MQYQVIPHTVYPRNRTVRTVWRVVDTDFGRAHRIAASCDNQMLADCIAKYLNGNDAYVRHACEERDRLKAERDEARRERDEARAALAAAHREIRAAKYCMSQAPHDHVVMSLVGYNKLVTERDEALAKFAACVDVVSFVDGKWVRTS